MLLGKRVLSLMAIISCLPWLPARGDEGPAKASPEEIAKLARQLDADTYAERQAASEKLAAVGKAAIPELAKTAVGDSLEATVRSIDILKKLFQSSDEATKDAAKAALETIAKGDKPAAARRAREVISPKKESNEDPQGANGGIFIVPGGIQVQAQAIQVEAGAGGTKRVSMKNTDGVREIEAEEGDRKVRIVDDPQEGIKMEMTTKKDSKETTEKFEAKSAEDLKKKHPKAYDVYKQYADNQGGGGGLRIQIGGGIAPMPVPALPAPVPLPVVPANPAGPGGQIDQAATMLKVWAEHLKRLTGDEALQKASKESKEELRKQVGELNKQLQNLEKRLQPPPQKAAEAAKE